MTFAVDPRASSPGSRRRKEASVAAEVAKTLCLLLRCGDLLVAIPAGDVTRIVLADDAVMTPPKDGMVRVQSGKLDAPAWGLGGLLGISMTPTCWVFLTREEGGRKVHLALGTGPCVAVRPMPLPEPLPAGLFRKLATAIVGGFRVDDALRARGCGIVGLWIDPILLVGAELR